MPQIGVGLLQATYTIGPITWTKVVRNSQPVTAAYRQNVDAERNDLPVIQYNRGGSGNLHLSIHTGFGGVITNVHYTNGTFNNAKLHYNLTKGTGAGNIPAPTLVSARYSVDMAQVGKSGKKGFSQQLATMQRELADFLVHSQIDTMAIQNMAVTDRSYADALALANAPADWGVGRKTKRGTVFTLS